MTDLAAVAGTLTRAADLIEQLARDYSAEQLSGQWAANDDQVRTVDGQAIAEAWTWRMTHHMAAFDPVTVAALVPLLRTAAALAADQPRTSGPDHVPAGVLAAQLHTFAARLLGEEDR